MNSIGNDISAEMNNSQLHKHAMEYISAHLKVGKFASQDCEEKVENYFDFDLFPLKFD